MNLDITYRGPLASCDYACMYCPFAKKHDDAEARAADQKALERFVDWVASRHMQDRIRILITPWGEALVRKWYRAAIIKLSHMAHVDKVVIQTNLSTPVDWLADSHSESVALWTTFHPTETSIEKFITKTQALDTLGVKHSVGIVGKNENQLISQALRKQLNDETYLWINAYKDDPNHYSAKDIAAFTKIDPLFDLNNQRHQSLGMECRAGCTAVSVDGEGNVKPCHFVQSKIGNLYEKDIHNIINDTFLCPNTTCGCYIGYIHLKELALEKVYGDNILERIPVHQI